MLFSFTYMAAFQHGIFVCTGFFSVNSIHSQYLGISGNLCSGNSPDTLDPHFADLFNIQLSFTANTYDIGFFSVHTMLFQKLVKAICIAGLQTDHGFSFQLGSFDHILA